MSKSFREKWGNRLQRGFQEPHLILPFLKERLFQHFIKPRVKEKIEERGGTFVARGGVKEVYRVPFHFRDGTTKDFAVSFFRKPVSEKGSCHEYVEKIRSTRGWYERTLGKEFLNEEKVFPQEGANLILYVQPWIHFHEQRSRLLSDIPRYTREILREMEADSSFRTQMERFAQRVLSAYRRSGLFPDMFHNFAIRGENPQNLYVSEDGRLLFLDTHTVYIDPRKTRESFPHLATREVQGRMFPYLEKLLYSLETIAKQGE